MENISIEFILRDEVCRLLDNFAALMKIQAVFFSIDGRILKRGRNYGNSDYCCLMQERYFGMDACRRLDEEKQEECSKSGSILCYTCHAGLNEVIAPVIVYGNTVGFIMFGQFRTSDTPPKFIRKPDALAAFRALPLIPEFELANLLDMLKMLIDYIVARELVSLPGDHKLHRINQYISKHLTENITLRQMSRHLSCSESSLTHYLRYEHGTSFKKILASKRISAAEKLMKNNPALTIAEIASMTGYDDPHYFSRVYRKIRGRPPGASR